MGLNEIGKGVNAVIEDLGGLGKLHGHWLVRELGQLGVGLELDACFGRWLRWCLCGWQMAVDLINHLTRILAMLKGYYTSVSCYCRRLAVGRRAVHATLG